jgi:hypothetical protein
VDNRPGWEAVLADTFVAEVVLEALMAQYPYEESLDTLVEAYRSVAYRSVAYHLAGNLYRPAAAYH